MKTTKEILSENRDSIISSIKWTFKVYRQDLIKAKMVEFLNWAEKNESDIQRAYESKKTKTLLKSFVMNMAYEQNKPQREAAEKNKDTRKWYEIAEDVADQRGLHRDSRTGKMYKVA